MTKKTPPNSWADGQKEANRAEPGAADPMRVAQASAKEGVGARVDVARFAASAPIRP
jgi:hypothetical protein